MYDVIALGELLVDLAERSKDEAGYPTLAANPGGAPGNFLAALSAYGKKTAFLAKVGDDTFGRLLVGTMQRAGIDGRGIRIDPDTFTTLAFVTFDAHGDRSFAFARKPGADTQLRWDEIDPAMLDETHVFHFGSLSCTDEPARSATQSAVAYARAHGHRGICSESEWRPIQRDLELVRETGCGYHVCHISTKESVALIRKAKAEGLPVSCETGPHYLILCDEDLMDDGRFKMNPPIRSAADRDALIEGLLDGTIDCIATDHAPHSAEEKSRGLRSLNGIVGLECAFPVLYTELVEPGIVPFATLLNALCVNPRRLFRLPGGKIEAGEIADLTVLDLNRPHAINSTLFFSQGRSTPFDGWTVTAGVDKTICNGNLVYTASSRNINKTPIPPCQEDYL